MDNSADNFDQAVEDILTYTASDEALEAAAGTGYCTSYPHPSTTSVDTGGD